MDKDLILSHIKDISCIYLISIICYSSRVSWSQKARVGTKASDLLNIIDFDIIPLFENSIDAVIIDDSVNLFDGVK